MKNPIDQITATGSVAMSESQSWTQWQRDLLVRLITEGTLRITREGLIVRKTN